jgi:hypothetical protein
MGHALYVQSPSDVFGSLINDTEEFLEDFQNRNSAGTSVYSPLSSPAFSPPYRDKKRTNPKLLKKPNTPGQVNLLMFEYLKINSNYLLLAVHRRGISFTQTETVALGTTR